MVILHFLIDKLYSDDEDLLKKLPELLILNKSDDFVGKVK